MQSPYRHAIYWPHQPDSSRRIVIEGEEAKHAVRVKRIKPGQNVALLDGQGHRVITEVVEATRTLVLETISRETVPPSHPRLEICSATPKGPRAGTLIDLISQAGADAWSPLTTAFGVESVSPSRHERLERVAIESLKQCGRPWLLEIGETIALLDAIDLPPATDLIIADATGHPYSPRQDCGTIRVLVGPEGGWRDDERAGAIAAGARACSFGPHVMRIETAAAAATAIIRNAWNQP